MSAIRCETLGADGEVTLYCGDCLEILPTLPQVGAVVTDPPYGIGWKQGAYNGGRSRPGIVNDCDTTVRDRALEAAGDVPALVFGSFYAPAPARVAQVLVWRKPGDAGVIGSVTGFRRDAEPVFMVGPWPKRPARFSSVLQTGGGQGATTKSARHPHAKPVGLMRTLVRFTDGPVRDPFMGSGSTGVACASLGRPFTGIEIDPVYFEIALERISRELAQPKLFGPAPCVFDSAVPSGWGEA
jgi:hypothetical protein